MLQYPRNVKPYNDLMRSNRVTVVMFSKKNCTACASILPHVVQLAATNPKVLFIYADADKFSEIQDIKDVKVFQPLKFIKTGNW